MGTTKQAITSSRVRFGKSTFFFDVYTSSNNKKYIRVTESRFVEEGKDRIRQSFVLFPDNVKEFQKQIADMAVALS